MPVLIAAVCRSPFTAIQAALAGWHPVDLAALVMNETLRRAGVEQAPAHEVWVGCAEPVGAQGADMARAAVLAAGWPDDIGGTVIDRADTSGAAALHAAIAALRAGQISSAMVIGVSVASMVPPGASALARTYGPPWGDGPGHRMADSGGLLAAPLSADRAAAEAGIDRRTQESWSLRSHRLRSQSAPSSLMSVDGRPGDRIALQRGVAVTKDQSREQPADPATLPPGFDPDGTVTGFTFAPPVDGAAAVLLTTASDLDRTSVPDRPAVIGIGRSAGHPRDPLGGLERAVSKACEQGGVSIGEIGRWELTEPTAAVTLLAIERLAIDPERVNLHGGTLGVGDAAGAEEIRLLTDAVGSAGGGTLVACASYGPVGAAVTLVRCP